MEILGYLPVCLLLLPVYFLPALNAFGRGHKNSVPIFLCNLFFGWTFLGWIVSLIWSATGNVTRNRFVEWLEKPGETSCKYCGAPTPVGSPG
jgi:hypothetical protein